VYNVSILKIILVILVSLSIGGLVGWLIRDRLFGTQPTELFNPFVNSIFEPDKPLLDYSFNNLRLRSYQSSQIKIIEELSDEPEFKAYLFEFTTLGKKMTGQLNLPKQPIANSNPKTILLLRGWVPQGSYQTGVGTSPAAEVFASQGYITVAPDFFGYGGSDPEPTDSWQARLEKPIIIIELLETIKKSGLPIDSEGTDTATSDNIGIWGHSNGGQIALSVLEITGQPIPTTLWAPVTAPFPYSILFFSDEEVDEGKGSRLYVSQLEELYDVFDFSITRYLHLLRGPIQLHQGLLDEAVPYIWNDEFDGKIKAENLRREELLEASEAASLIEDDQNALLEPINFEYFRYPNTDHNMRPSWNAAIQRDLAFFVEHLVQE
jgi:pimeloyl-ACP methyl ester carboxylesterase